MDRMINLIKTDKKKHIILIRFINTCSNLLITQQVMFCSKIDCIKPMFSSTIMLMLL